MASDDERIGPTAHYTAYAWYRLRLPYAHLFATRKGARMFWLFRGALEWPALLVPDLPTLADWLELRHRTMDRTLEELAPDRVVEIAAGLSRRGVTWAADHGVPYVEVDLPHMVAAKGRLLERRASPGLRRRLAGRLDLVADDVLSDGFADRLARHLDGAARPVVITEGLLTYFAIPDRHRIMGAIGEALARRGGGSYLFEVRTERGRAAMPWASQAVRLAAGVATRGRGHRGDFADEAAVREALRGAGFAEAQPLTPAAHEEKSFPGAVWHGRL